MSNKLYKNKYMENLIKELAKAGVKEVALDSEAYKKLMEWVKAQQGDVVSVESKQHHTGSSIRIYNVWFFDLGDCVCGVRKVVAE